MMQDHICYNGMGAGDLLLRDKGCQDYQEFGKRLYATMDES